MSARARVAALATALLVCLLLAPSQARAADECGAVSSSSTTATCSNQAYGTGIIYRSKAHALTLNVPGGSATAITTATSTSDWASGIVMDTTSAGGAIALTVGASGAVTIAQASGGPSSSWNHNRGILIRQRSSGTTTVDLRSGVTIGTSTARMMADGVWVILQDNDGGTASLTSAATIWSATRGLHLIRNASAADTTAATTITNSGAVTATQDGILLDHRRPSANTFTGSATLTNTGTVTTTGTGRRGLDLNYEGYGAALIDNRAAVTATATSSVGIRLRQRTAASAGTVKIMNSGVVQAHDDAIHINNVGTGAATIENTGALTSSNGLGIHLWDGGATGTGATATVTNGADVTSSGDGILVQTRDKDNAGTSAGVSITHSTGTITSSAGNGIDALVGRARSETDTGHADYVAPVNTGLLKVSVTGGTISSKWAPIQAINYEAGGIEIAVSEDVTMTTTDDHGIYAQLTDPGNASGGVSIASGAALTAKKNGISVTRAAGSGAVSVENSGAVATQDAASAWSAIRIDDSGTGGVSVENSGALGAAGKRFTFGVSIEHTGSAGGVTVENSGDIMPINTGVHVHVPTSAGNVSVTNSGAVGSASERAERGLSVHQMASGTAGSVSVANSGAIAAEDYGIFARTHNKDAAGADADVTVTHSGGAIDVRNDRSGIEQAGVGVSARIGHYRSENDAGGDGYAAPVNAGGVKVSVTGGSITSKGNAVEAINYEAGWAEITVSEGVEITSETGRGLWAWLADVGQRSGSVIIESAGSVTAERQAIYAAPKASNGDVSVTVLTGGSVVSRARAGVWAHYNVRENDNGQVNVTVQEGASVTGNSSGIHVRNAGRASLGRNSERGRALFMRADKTVRRQHVTVAGTVRGGSVSGVHILDGGTLLVEKTGRILAGSSGVAVLADNDTDIYNVVLGADPQPQAEGEVGEAVVHVEGEVKGAVHLAGGGCVTIGLNGRVEANGAPLAIRGDAPTTVVFHVLGDLLHQGNAADAVARVQGGIGGDGVDEIGFVLAQTQDGLLTGHLRDVSLDSGGAPMLDELPVLRFDCGMAEDARCELYEAAPSLLLAMTRLPSHAERMSAPRGSNGVWGRVEGAKGEWTADAADSVAESEKLGYDYDVAGGRAGLDFEGAGGRFGVSVHMLRAKAERKGAGEIALNGVGLGASASWFWGNFYLDVAGQATAFDADFDSAMSGSLKKDADGVGGALGVEIGRRMSFMEGAFAVTPRLGMVWSSADLDDFTDSVGSTARVSVESARSARARAGFTLETGAGEGRLFLSADLERELSRETAVKVAGDRLKARANDTTARLGAGGAFPISESATLTLSGSYAASGGGTKEYGGAASVSVRF